MRKPVATRALYVHTRNGHRLGHLEQQCVGYGLSVVRRQYRGFQGIEQPSKMLENQEDGGGVLQLDRGRQSRHALEPLD
jgi:hypothetical protein